MVRERLELAINENRGNPSREARGIQWGEHRVLQAVLGE
jgi:hypothetical protein